MKKLCILFVCSLVLIACGKETKNKTNQPVKKEVTKPKQTKKVVNKIKKLKAAETATPIDLDNKGIGPISSLKFGKLDQKMADKGAKIFKLKCTACHKTERRMIGPALKGIYEKRSPEWVMNIMLNPTEMLKKDPIAKALLKEYKNVMMINQNLSQEEARSLAEYFRTL